MLQQLAKIASSGRLRLMLGVLLGCGLITAVIISTFSHGEDKNYLPIVLKEPYPVTPMPPCPARFVATPMAGQTSSLVTGHVNTIVSIVNQTTGETMGTDTVMSAGGYQCPGLADFAEPYQLSQPLIEGHSLQLHGDDDSLDTAVVTTPAPQSPQLTHFVPVTTPPPPQFDLAIYNPPQLISTPPIVAYQPVQFTVLITNTGDIDVVSQFFVDLYIDPQSPLVITTTIPVTESDGYTAVSSLANGSSRVVTITSQLGFANEPEIHHVYAIVDSLDAISESDETNNISPPAIIDFVTPASPPSDHTISGIAYLFSDSFTPQYRALIRVYDSGTGNPITQTETDVNGMYEINDLSASQPYHIDACITIDGNEYYGYRTNVSAPHDLVYVNLLQRPCPNQPPIYYPYIVVNPTCGLPSTNPGNVIFNVHFLNWPTDESLTLSWEGIPEIVWQANQHNGSFTISMTKNLNQESDSYTILAQSENGANDQKTFTVPCE